MESWDLFGYLEQCFSIVLNPQQKRAVETQSRYVLLLAVPGSGKTTVLVSRIAYMLKSGLADASSLLTLTFSRESARDMKHRFETLFTPVGLDAPRFSTIHSFCYTVLRYYANRYQRQFPQLISGGEEISSVRLLREIHQEVNGEYLSDDLLESLSNAISLSKNLMYTSEEINELDTGVDRFVEIFERYEKIKKQKNWMDYDDLLVFALDILRKKKPVLEYFRSKYRWILVDEAQDTSKIQFEILKLFAPTAGLFVVGDEDQCIYSFRGAYPQGLLQFPQVFSGAEVLKLEENYRSRSDLVKAANEFIQINQDRYPKNMFCSRQGEGSISYIELDDYSQQYTELRRCYQMLPEGETMAVLYRNNESAVPVLDLLNREGIPYYMKEHNLKFFNSFVVRDILSFFTLAYDPCNLEAFGQIYYKCMCSKMVYIYVKYNLEQYGSVFEAAAHCPDAQPYVRTHLLELDRNIRRLRGKRPLAAIQMVEDKLGYRTYLEKRMGKNNPVNLNLKLSILKTIARNYQDMETFVDNLLVLEQKLQQGNREDAHARLTLSSIHSSKGLEWDRVVLVDLIESIFPGQQAADEMARGRRQEMEGEARLFYVAATRARKKLIIYTSSYCNDEYVAKSRFVTRLNQEEWMEGVEIQGDWKGKRVRHRYFGDGVVTSHQGDVLEIYFVKHGVKQFSCQSCLESGVLKQIKDR